MRLRHMGLGLHKLQDRIARMSKQKQTTGETLYLAYGSNLSTTQMSQRCPESRLVGVAVLEGWRWIINERGYANIVEAPSFRTTRKATGASSRSDTALPAQTAFAGSGLKDEQIAMPPYAPLSSFHSLSDVTYGLVYAITPTDESLLDGYEGVPWAYTKETVDVRFYTMDTSPQAYDAHPTRHAQFADSEIDGLSAAENVRCIAYVDRHRIRSSKPKTEYVSRMRRGVEEAVGKGLPVDWAKNIVGQSIDLKGLQLDRDR